MQDSFSKTQFQPLILLKAIVFCDIIASCDLNISPEIHFGCYYSHCWHLGMFDARDAVLGYGKI